LERSDNVADSGHAFAVLKRGYLKIQNLRDVGIRPAVAALARVEPSEGAGVPLVAFTA
jgi:hypothetical protein